MNDERGVAPAPVPADVGIVAALPIEIEDVIQALTQVRKYQSAGASVIEGECVGKIVAVATSGPGREAARRATDLLIIGHRPRWIISTGFAGALNPAFARNDLVLPDELIDRQGARHPVAKPTELGASCAHHKGRLLTVDRPVTSREEKSELSRTFQADLVDMETTAVAAVCDEKLVRFLSIRVISDDAHAELPREVATLMSRKGSYRVGAALRAVWQRPSSLKDFWTLYEHALEAADRLARFVVRCLGELPP
jgi:adenosylhomocysteine nucleosidase